MGYQALLFCTDEKLARVVSQLFSELEFAVTPVNDAFAAVKNLLAQHYDAVVIDCENEQSASLLIKSARSSSFNQGSLAIGLVEGQAGVAKAYRMGANLVLTKPINVEQAKGTLRVARGLLRKGSEAAAGHAATATPGKAYTPSFPPVVSTQAHHDPVDPHTAQYAAPQYETHDSPEVRVPMASVAAVAQSEEPPALAPPIRIKPWTALGGQPTAGEAPPAPVATQQASRPLPQAPAAKAEPPKPAVVPFVNATPRSQGAASAPAPAREVVTSAQSGHVLEDELEDAAFGAPPAMISASADTMSAGPSFSAIEQGSGSGGSQKILIGAVAVLLVITAYFGWTKFGQPHSTPAAAPVAVAPAPQPVPQTVPDARSAPAPLQATPAVGTHIAAATSSAHTTSSTQPAHTPDTSAPAQTVSTSQSSDVKPAPAPIMVKPGTTTKAHQTQSQAQEEVSALPPSALGVASPSEGSLSGVLTATAAKPSLSRVRVSQGVSQGLLIEHVPPRYPVNALSTHTQGAVQIEATVDKEGRVVNPKVLSGSPLLAPAALEAVRQWRYKPYYLDGEPVEIQTQITIKFKTQ